MKQTQTISLSVADIYKLVEPALSRAGYSPSSYRILSVDHVGKETALESGYVVTDAALRVFVELKATKNVAIGNTLPESIDTTDLDRKISLAL